MRSKLFFTGTEQAIEGYVENPNVEGKLLKKGQKRVAVGTG